MTNDMTKGNPLKLILAFMIPAYLGNIFQQLYNLADAIIAGRHLGVDALAAIGGTYSLMFIVTGWINGITSGFAVLVSQSFGAKKFEEMRKNVAMAVVLCTGFVVVMTVGLSLLNRPILGLLNTPDNIVDDMAGYMGIIYAGLLTTMAYNGLAAVLRALGDSRSPLYFLIISAVINVGLDLLFLVQFHMGVEGCAYATVIAQGISAVLCLIYIIKKFDILKLKKKDFQVDVETMGRLLGMGIPMGLQFSITGLSTAVVQSAVNVFGSVYIAGFSAGGKISNFIGAAFSSLGVTAATFVGQNRGAGRLDRIKTGTRQIQLIILVWSLIMFLIVNLFGDQLIRLFIDENQSMEAVAAAKEYFRAVSWCYPFLGSIFLYRNALQGLGYGLVPMLGGVFELAARAGVVAVVSALGGGYFVICLSDPAAWLFALIPLVPYYFYKISKLTKQEKQGKSIAEG